VDDAIRKPKLPPDCVRPTVEIRAESTRDREVQLAPSKPWALVQQAFACCSEQNATGNGSRFVAEGAVRIISTRAELAKEPLRWACPPWSSQPALTRAARYWPNRATKVRPHKGRTVNWPRRCELITSLSMTTAWPPQVRPALIRRSVSYGPWRAVPLASIRSTGFARVITPPSRRQLLIGHKRPVLATFMRCSTPPSPTWRCVPTISGNWA